MNAALVTASPVPRCRALCVLVLPDSPSQPPHICSLFPNLCLVRPSDHFGSETPCRNPLSPISCWPNQGPWHPQQREGKGRACQMAGGGGRVMLSGFARRGNLRMPARAAGMRAEPDKARSGGSEPQAPSQPWPPLPQLTVASPSRRRSPKMSWSLSWSSTGRREEPPRTSPGCLRSSPRWRSTR